MKKTAVIVALFVSCLSVEAIAAEGPYFGANVGATMTNNSDVKFPGYPADKLSFDNGFGIGAALGYNFGSGRIEAEIGYKTADVDTYTDNYYEETYSVDGDVSILSVMGNAYLDFNASPSVKPYLMAGIGMANISMDDGDEDDDDTVFAYQVGAGVGIPLNDKVTLDLGYRYMGTADPEFDGIKGEYSSHNFLAGIRLQY